MKANDLAEMAEACGICDVGDNIGAGARWPAAVSGLVRGDLLIRPAQAPGLRSLAGPVGLLERKATPIRINCW